MVPVIYYKKRRYKPKYEKCPNCLHVFESQKEIILNDPYCVTCNVRLFDLAQNYCHNCGTELNGNKKFEGTTTYLHICDERSTHQQSYQDYLREEFREEMRKDAFGI